MKKNAIICEGSAEEAIIEILLENSLLVIKNDEDLLEDGPVKTRSAEAFCEKHLGRDFGGKVEIYRILDSRREKFNFNSKKAARLYEEKLIVHDIITAPEIEVLVIIAEEKYQKFLRTKKKPSKFCKEDLKIKDVKSYDFVKAYFQDYTILLNAIKTYRRLKGSKDEETLYDLLEDNYK